MPIVTISMMEGREPHRIEAMIAAVSDAIATSLPAPIDTVRVLVNELQSHQYGVGGLPMHEVLARRAAATETPS